ncbi:MAG: hypothetical protein ACI8RZ_001993 [Myxococcota bacterium]|jgi:hypothetical protein
MSEESRAWEVVAQANERTGDALDSRPPRRRLGERTLQRVGARGWERPNVATSGRLFARCRLPDPWDPTPRTKAEESIGLGPVSLRLGTKRRQPAPHLKPKEPAKKKKATAAPAPRQGNLPPGFKPPSGVSQASATTSSGGSRLPPGFKPPRGVPDAKATAAYKPPKPPPRPLSSSGEFGGKKVRGLVGKIPMRPDLAAKKAAASKPAPSRSAPSRPAPSRTSKPGVKPPAAPRASTPKATPPSAEKSTWLPPGFKPPRGVPDAKKAVSWSPPPPPPKPTKSTKSTTTGREFGGPQAHRVVGKLPMRPDLAGKTASGPAKDGGATAPVNRTPPMPPAAKKKRRGRFRMTPRTTTTAPVITEVRESVPVRAEPKPSKPTRPMIPATAGGLDDLFGFAAQEGRMRLKKK